MSDALPSEGHADWVRDEVWHLRELVNVSGAPSTGGASYGPVLVHDALSLEVYVAGDGEHHALAINYFADEAETVALGFTRYVLPADGTMRFVAPVVGRWVRMVVTRDGLGVAGTHDLYVAASRRASPARVIAGADDLLFTGDVTVAAGATVEYAVDNGYFGPALWHVRTASPDFHARLRGRNEDGLVNRDVAFLDERNTMPHHSHVLLPALRAAVEIKNNDASDRSFNTSLVPVAQ